MLIETLDNLFIDDLWIYDIVEDKHNWIFSQ